MGIIKNPGIELQERDIAVLRDLFESRVMSFRHVTQLHFAGREEAAKKRIQRLKAAGFICERPRKPFEPSVLYLSRNGFCVLSGRGLLTGYPPLSAGSFERRAQVSRLTIDHELAVLDAKAELSGELRAHPSLRVFEFSTWPLLSQFESYRTDRTPRTVKPDAFIRIHENHQNGETSEHAFFLEVDRSTETQDILAEKAACYVHYYRSGGFARRHGATSDDYQQYPFRVLILCKTRERRNNAAERLLRLDPPILRMVLLSTIEEFLSGPLGSTWITPALYREALKGTSFDVLASQQSITYRRQTERDKLVEEKVQAVSFLE